MNLLVIGSGGREHAIIWKLKQSSRVKKIYCAHGNAGISQLAELVPIDPVDIDGLKQFVISHKIDLTIVGPETPLSLGISDIFQNAGLKIFGPVKKGALLESSKIFAKEFMAKYKIPTADFNIFDNPQKAIDFFKTASYPLVIKADGLAAGKGVIIAEKFDDALIAVKKIMIEKIFGESGNKILVEKFLTGEEASILAFIDGNTIKPMVSAQDHKRIFDQDKGPNTGGMGAYSPAPIVTPIVEKNVKEKIFNPLLKGLIKEGIDYKGIIYAGIMIEKEEPKLLEFNVRFGDPETQAVLVRLKSDLLEIILATVENRLNKINLEWYADSSLCVVIASGGYPENYEKGKIISGLDELSRKDDIIGFHAATALLDNKIVTSGGRVFGITGKGKNLREAQKKAYEGVNKIKFDNMFFRQDIGYRALDK